MKQHPDEKVVFGIAPDGTGDGAPLVRLGIPERAWANLRAGKCSTFDLTKAGLAVKIVIYGAKDHDEAMKVIQTHNKSVGAAYLDQRGEDFSIATKPGH